MGLPIVVSKILREEAKEKNVAKDGAGAFAKKPGRIAYLSAGGLAWRDLLQEMSVPAHPIFATFYSRGGWWSKTIWVSVGRFHGGQGVVHCGL